MKNLPKDRFNSEWRQVAAVAPASVTAAASFVAAHYLRKRPAIVLACFIMTVNGSPVGCAIYSAPPRECDRRYGGKTWELARLYLLDEIPRNAETWLISESIRHIRRNRPDVEFLVSYADPSAGHSGTIYRASNWNPDGRTDEGRKTPRCDYVDTRTGKKYGRRGNVPEGATLARVPRVSKWRFVYPMNRKGRK